MAIELTSCCILIIVAMVNLSSADVDADKLRKLGARSWDLLKAEKNPVWRDPPAILFPKRPNNLPNPEPNLAGLRKLRSVEDYDPRYMSVTKPRSNATNLHGALSRKQLMASMPSDLKILQFPVPGSDRELGIRASKKLRLWLWNMSSCPVLPLWKDFGALQWPRYLNVGQCWTKKTCSYPKGMKCKPSKTKRIRTFWWYCNEKLISTKGTHCVWVKFHIEVVEKCKCSC